MILEEMYSGRFYPCETVVPTSEVYRKAVKACENLMEQLSQRLSKEDYELVKELRAQTAIAQCEESRLSRKKLFGRFQHSPVDLFTLL